MRKELILSSLICCIFLSQPNAAMQNKYNNINMQAFNESCNAQIIEADLDDDDFDVTVEQNITNLDNFLDELSNDKKFITIRDINNKILNEEENVICSKFKIDSYVLSKYKRYWNQLKVYAEEIKKEVNNSDELEINTILMSGNLSLSVCSIMNEIENNFTIIENNIDSYLNKKRKPSLTKIISNKNDLEGNNIFNGIYILSRIISWVIIEWQSPYIDAFMVSSNHLQNRLVVNCRKQLDKIFEIFSIIDK